MTKDNQTPREKYDQYSINIDKELRDELMKEKYNSDFSSMKELIRDMLKVWREINRGNGDKK